MNEKVKSSPIEELFFFQWLNDTINQ